MQFPRVGQLPGPTEESLRFRGSSLLFWFGFRLRCFPPNRCDLRRRFLAIQI